MCPSPLMRDATRQSTILVVDDEPSIHRLLTDYLGDKGYRVRAATSVNEAVACLLHSEVDAVVLDVRMPAGSGLALLEYVRSNSTLKDVPVMVFTGAALRPEDERIIASCRAYVFYKQEALDEFGAYVDKLTSIARGVSR